MYRFVHSVVAPTARTIWRPTVSGLEHVPPSGGVILASNHRSFVDSVVIPCVVPRKVVFLAKSDYFTGTGVKGAVQRAWFEGLGMLPVDRDDTRAAIDSLDTALEVLGNGDAFGIYPEGTRSRDGRLYRGRTGVARLAIETGVPVLPVAVLGTDIVAPPGKTFGRWTRPRVRFGRPLDFSRYAGLQNDRFVLRSATDEIMYEILRMSGQEYVDVYASEAKALDKEARPGGGRAAA